jgi:ABC-type sugar transport system permease subunit
MEIKKSKHISLASQHSLYGYIFTTPLIIGIILFFLSPFVLFIVMGFSDIKLSNNGLVFSFAGLEYYKIFLVNNMTYINEVLASLMNIVITLPAIVIYSFFIAILLNQKFKGRTFFRAVFFLPVIIASGIAVLSNSDQLVQSAISSVSGTGGASSKDTLNFAGMIIQLLGPGYYQIVADWIQPLISNIYLITLSSGVQILIFLAAIQTVPTAIYEAANIDGATAWETFWKITLPYLSPMILVNAVYTLIDMLGGANNVVIKDIYDQINANTKFSLGAGMGTLYFAIIFAVMGLIIFGLSKVVYYEDR